MGGPDVCSGGGMVQASVTNSGIPIKRLGEAYLEAKKAKRPPLSPRTIDNCKWAIKWLSDCYEHFPTHPDQVSRFVAAQKHLKPSTKQVLYDILRDFYGWTRTYSARAGKEIPEMPTVSFGGRKRGKGRPRVRA